jgi:hypothetical protein
MSRKKARKFRKNLINHLTIFRIYCILLSIKETKTMTNTELTAKVMTLGNKPAPRTRGLGTTQCTGSCRELLEQDIRALHMKAYGYDYDHALDDREPAWRNVKKVNTPLGTSLQCLPQRVRRRRKKQR